MRVLVSVSKHDSSYSRHRIIKKKILLREIRKELIPMHVGKCYFICFEVCSECCSFFENSLPVSISHFAK